MKRKQEKQKSYGSVKEIVYTHRGGNLVEFFLSTLSIGVFYEREEFALRSELFLLRIDPLPEGVWCNGKQIKSHNI